MSEIHSPAGTLPHIPDSLTVPQFILDYQHVTRPIRTAGVPWLIEDATAREIGLEEVSSMAAGLIAGRAQFHLLYVSFVRALLGSQTH
jgi:4-coumarate--CoA ligase